MYDYATRPPGSRLTPAQSAQVVPGATDESLDQSEALGAQAPLGPGHVPWYLRRMTQKIGGFGRDAAGHATLGGRSLHELLGEAGVTTPAYFYDLDAIEGGAAELVGAFGGARHLVAYALKANTAGSIVRAAARGGAGADVVSGAELEVALACGIPARKIVMSGVAKTAAEIDTAIARDVLALQTESVEELQRIAARARALGKRARVTLRVNPNVEIDSHAHISTGHDAAKFGIARRDLARAFEAIDQHAEHLCLVGISTHVGSMLTDTAPYADAARAVCAVARERRQKNNELEYVSFGGGYGIDYGAKEAPRPAAFAGVALELLRAEGLGDLMLVVEPGRSLVGAYGVLVASVVQSKTSGDRRWLMIDAGMNDLIRPALYGARHRIEPLDAQPSGTAFRVVGPVCESSDDFGEHVIGEVPERVAIRDAGAYSFAMASEYNGRALPSEVFVQGGRVVHVSRSPGAEAWISRRLQA